MSSMLTFRMNSCVATLLSHCSFITGNTTAHAIWGQGQNLRLHRLRTCVIIFERLWYSLNTWFVITWSINKRQIAIPMPPCLSHLICRQLRKNFKGMIWIPRPHSDSPPSAYAACGRGLRLKQGSTTEATESPRDFAVQRCWLTELAGTWQIDEHVTSLLEIARACARNCRTCILHFERLWAVYWQSTKEAQRLCPVEIKEKRFGTAKKCHCESPPR